MDVSKYVITSEQLLEKYAPLIGDQSDCLWGEQIRRGAITAIIGETNAGKTTLLHNLVYRLAQGLHFLDISPPHPVKTFYCDYESFNAVLAEHLVDIGVADNWHFLNREADAITPRGTMLIQVLDELIHRHHYDMVVIDPLMDADPVDENDNTAASMQCSRWRDLARKHNCAVLLVHNTGKGTDMMSPKDLADTARIRSQRKHTGRGASSRTDRYDVQLNYTVVDKVTRLLTVAKTRSKRNRGDNWTLKFKSSDVLDFVIENSEFNVSHVSPPIENETMRQLIEVVSAHPDESLNTIWRQYIDGVMPISRATFYRHAPLVRSQPEAVPEISESVANGGRHYSASDSTTSPVDVETGPHHIGGGSHPSSGTAGQTAGPPPKGVIWRSPHHGHGSYGRFVVTSEADVAPPL